MSETFRVQRTSARSAKVEDLWLDPPDDPDSALTRRIVRAELVDHVHSREARVKICLDHQRRHRKSVPWEDVDGFNLATLKAGQAIKLQLDTGETYQLYRALERLYSIAEVGLDSTGE